MVNDDNAIARQMDVEFETVGAEREAVVERGNRVLGRERGAAAMRKDKRTCGGKKGATRFG